MSSGVALYIEPPSHHFSKDRLFEPDAAPYAGDRIMAPYSHLRSVLASVQVEAHTADLMPADLCGIRALYVSIGNLRNIKAIAERHDVILSAVFAMECPTLDPGFYRRLPNAQRRFKRIFSWSDSASLQRFTREPLRLEPFRWPQSFDAVHEDIWSNPDRKFLVIINANRQPAVPWQSLHRERLRAIEYFDRYGEIDLYGREWDQPPYTVGKGHIPYTLRWSHRRVVSYWHRVRPDPLLQAARRAWRGPTLSKSRTLGAYTFAICFENTVLKGWMTEKLFDCFFAGTIPIYWGAPDVALHVPEECYIDMRRFESYADLRALLHSLSPGALQRYRESAREFISSAAFRPFSKQAFANIFLRIVREDAFDPNEQPSSRPHLHDGTWRA